MHAVAAPVLRRAYGGQGFELVAYLEDMWVDMEVQPGDTVNAIGPVEVSGGTRCMRVNARQGLIVLHPDVLLSGAPRGRSGAGFALGWVRG